MGLHAVLVQRVCNLVCMQIVDGNGAGVAIGEPDLDARDHHLCERKRPGTPVDVLVDATETGERLLC